MNETVKTKNSHNEVTAQVVTHILPEFDSHWWGPHANLLLSMKIKDKMGKSAQCRLKEEKQALSIVWKCQWDQPRNFWGEVYPLSQAHSSTHTA